MRLASFPAASSWFRRALLQDMTLDELHAMEPRNATLRGITSSRTGMHTASIVIDGEAVSSATHRKAAEAVRLAVAKLPGVAA